MTDTPLKTAAEIVAERLADESAPLTPEETAYLRFVQSTIRSMGYAEVPWRALNKKQLRVLRELGFAVKECGSGSGMDGTWLVSLPIKTDQPLGESPWD